MDIDIDLADRQQLLDLIDHVPASIKRDDQYVKHNSGVYFQAMPTNPFLNVAAIDYVTAESLGFFKLDLLNVHIYQRVRDNDHLQNLMAQEPVWEILQHKEIVEQLIHIGEHYNTLIQMPEPIKSIEHLAMFLAIIRPSKRWLIGKTWNNVAEHIWEVPQDNSYYFKRAHAFAYAHLVVINMNLLTEEVI